MKRKKLPVVVAPVAPAPHVHRWGFELCACGARRCGYLAGSRPGITGMRNTWARCHRPAVEGQRYCAEKHAAMNEARSA